MKYSNKAFNYLIFFFVLSMVCISSYISSIQITAYKTGVFHKGYMAEILHQTVSKILHQTVSKGNNQFSLASEGDAISCTSIFSIDISFTKQPSDVSAKSVSGLGNSKVTTRI